MVSQPINKKNQFFISRLKALKQNQKIRLLVLVIAIVILIIFLYNAMKVRTSSQMSKESPQDYSFFRGREEKENIVLNSDVSQREIPPQIQAILITVGREDPFLIPERKKASLQLSSNKLTLIGIVWDAQKPLAIINDTIVSIGEMIGDKQVSKIEKDKVVLIQQDGREIILELF